MQQRLSKSGHRRQGCKERSVVNCTVHAGIGRTEAFCAVHMALAQLRSPDFDAAALAAMSS